MNIKRILLISSLVVSLSVVSFAAVSLPTVQLDDDIKMPDLPPACAALQVQPGHRVISRLYAVGVQAYRWNGTGWTFVEPIATLFANAEYHKKFGVHYVGPTWESNSGGKVVAARQEGCSPDPTAIPWLLLKTVTADGSGIFGRVTYIQRVNTKGGLTPTAPGATIGAVAEVPYSTEYYFYRADD